MILSTDILWKLSIKTGSAGNSLAQADPNAALGKFISTTQWAGGVLHDLFDVVSGDDNAAGRVDYRCVFIHNNHATLPLLTPVVWLESEVANGAVTAIGVDPAAQSVIAQGSAQAAEIADELSVPAGVTFSAPVTKGTGISLGASLDAGKCRAIWIRRTAQNNTALDNDGATIRVEGDTAQ